LVERLEELPRGDDADLAVAAEGKQVPAVAGDQVVGAGRDGGGDDDVVLGRS